MQGVLLELGKREYPMAFALRSLYMKGNDYYFLVPLIKKLWIHYD
jgi:hypothetical protein